ncbi:unnamed protein product [Dicrocoelium dendriticum]|nr:unnamed protein product [Dicrocoelium dendriticum]
MSSARLLDLFKRDLENLKDNDKYKISALTVFARDHKDEENIPEGIVDLTTKHVHSIPAGLKLLGLKLYTGTIVDAFVHSFQAIRDEKGRLKLYNLRTTWKDIFPNTRMYELDIRVREHDPAWPLLATPPESKSAFRSLPSIPKLQPKPEVKDSDIEGSDTTSKAIISASRDPRLNRKRKSPSTAQPSSPGEEFLIDRSGDQKMESVARKQGKQEAAEQPKKTSLFGGEDLDMRSQLTPPLPSPARSGVWSSYIDKHAEVCSRRELKDVDMRVSTTVSSDKPTGSIDSSVTSPLVNSEPLRVPVLSSEIREPSRQPFVQPHQPSQNAILPTQPFTDATHGIVPTTREPNLMFPPPTPHPITLHSAPPPVYHMHNPPPFSPDLMNERPPPVPKLFTVPSHPPFRGPPISGPLWSVEIDGFPDMVNIGVDPRMLSLVPHPKPPRRITIDGRRYSLLLDRVQPLIMVGDQVHAVRFRCEFATVLINGRCFTIPGTGFTKIMVGWRPYQAYLGGPGHELIIDGMPHTIPLGSQLTFITVGTHSVGVKFVGELPRNVNVLPPIPPRLLKWAGQGLFGSPRSLHRVPLNPLAELSRLAEGRSFASHRSTEVKMRTEFNHTHMPDSSVFNEVGTPPVSVPNYAPPTSAPVMEAPVTTSTHADPPVVTSNTSPLIDVHALFQKLVKAGIVTDTTTQPLPELGTYSWDRFKVPCLTETNAIYNGHQCSQCGLRFQSDLSSEFAAHLDYHYMKNSSEHDRRSRNFYQPARYWLLSETVNEGTSQFDPGTPVPDLQESKCPAFADPSKNICAVCYEKFDVFWDHDEEEWMLRDAVLLQDKVYHPICQEDAGKEFPFVSNVAHDMQEVPLSPSALKCEPTVASESTPNSASSLSDENAFMCDDQHTAKIPGLSPDKSPTSPTIVTVPLKPDPDTSLNQSVKPEHNVIIPVYEHIKADPLAALRAVLHGGVSSLIQPPPSSP